MMTVYDDVDLSGFQPLLDRLMQSNMSVLTDQTRIDCTGHSWPQRLCSNVRLEILSKKKSFLYCVNNSDNQLCLAIGTAHVLEPGV